jgi:type VI secretion system protein VasG
VLARRYEWDMDAIWQDLLTFMDKLPRSVRPPAADAIQTLMQEAWLSASLAGEEHIRSIHLLMALVDKQKLVRCDGLWPLLTWRRASWRACPLLDAQSTNARRCSRKQSLAQGDEVAFVGRPVNAGVKKGI